MQGLENRGVGDPICKKQRNRSIDRSIEGVEESQDRIRIDENSGIDRPIAGSRWVSRRIDAITRHIQRAAEILVVADDDGRSCSSSEDQEAVVLAELCCIQLWQ
jgi:hypothetical protein